MDTLNEPGEAFQPNMHLVAHPVGKFTHFNGISGTEQAGGFTKCGHEPILLEGIRTLDCSNTVVYTLFSTGAYGEKAAKTRFHWGGNSQAHQEENSQHRSDPTSVGTIPV